MIENFKDFIRKTTHIEEQKLDLIISCFKQKTIKRNTTLLAAGQVCKDFYYLHSGCIRTFYITKEGLEKTRLILFDNSPVTALASFISLEPSVEWVDVLEDSALFYMSHSDFFRLVNNIPEWALFYRRVLERAFMFQNKKIEDLVTLSAGQRYEKLLKETPYYINRLSNKVLATYLDISQETLSRLKSK